jgi:hypothetical protein
MRSEVLVTLPPQSRDWYNDPAGVGARGGCNQHGISCPESIYASVVLRDGGSDDVRWAVCRRGLIALKGDDLIPGATP